MSAEDQRSWSPGPYSPPVFRPAICDCLSLNVSYHFIGGRAGGGVLCARRVRPVRHAHMPAAVRATRCARAPTQLLPRCRGSTLAPRSLAGDGRGGAGGLPPGVTHPRGAMRRSASLCATVGGSPRSRPRARSGRSGRLVGRGARGPAERAA